MGDSLEFRPHILSRGYKAKPSVTGVVPGRGRLSYVNIKNNNLNLVTLDNNYTNSVLKRINLSWPKITEEYLKAVIDYLIKNKFIGGYK